MRESKVWGFVDHLFNDAHAAVSLLQTVRWTCCSIHKHEERFNSFTVLEGRLVVELFGSEDGPKPDPDQRIELTVDNPTLIVEPGVWHRFVVVEGGRVVEVYWPRANGAVRSDDIQRWTTGSRFNVLEWEPV